MAMFGAPRPIETGEHIVRARRTAAQARIAVGLAGVTLSIAWPDLFDRPLLAGLGFATIVLSAAFQLAAPRLALLSVEESLSAGAGVLIVGFGAQRVGIGCLLWLVAIASGVLARGGRVHWLGRTVMLCGLALPVLLAGSLSAAYAAFALGTVALLLTAGRLTSELNTLLRQARMQADSAETLLLAGDIAARMSERVEAPAAGAADGAPPISEAEKASARIALARLTAGEGLSMVVQPIVDIGSGRVHAHEALARFGEAGGSPLHWLALADRLGGRAALERACLRKALELFRERPPGTSLSVNLSAPVLAEAATREMLEDARGEDPRGLHGLIVEITEETLVHSEQLLDGAIAPLLAAGAVLAVDDMGAGYSGLRQITAVRPAYLKLDRSLATGIDGDPERAALVAALAGYARQVGARLVVEGVETEAELERLRELRIQFVQGFLLGRPAPPWPGVAVRGAGVAGAPRAAHGEAVATGSHERASRGGAASRV